MKKIETMSDVGGIKVGNDNFSVIIQNGLGDGITETFILDRSEPVPVDVKFDTSINGNFNIYTYDCGDEIALSLSGRYGAYYKDGRIYLQKWD